MTDVEGNKVSISFELGDYAFDYHECEKDFYDMVVRFNDVDEIDELIATLTQLRNTYTMCG
jgi:hypothetical protein